MNNFIDPNKLMYQHLAAQELFSIKENRQMTWEQVALALCQILERNEQSKKFRTLVEKLQAKKNQILNVSINEEERDYTEIPLSNTDKKAIIDRDDLPKILKHAWHLKKDNRTGLRYVATGVRHGDKVETIRMHRLVANAPPDMDAHHKDLNPLNNRKNNLELIPKHEHRGHPGQPKQYHSMEESINESTMTEFALDELQKAGLFDKDSDYDGMIGEAVMELINTFAEQGHSGFSAGLTTSIFNKLAEYKPLSPLTDDPNEWMKISDSDYGCAEEYKNMPLCQSRRCPSCFSNDGGKTYYDIDDEGHKHVDEKGHTWNVRPEDYGRKTTMYTTKHINEQRPGTYRYGWLLPNGEIDYITNSHGKDAYFRLYGKDGAKVRDLDASEYVTAEKKIHRQRKYSLRRRWK